ncbi:MAG: hypothetical protein IPI49_11340 [Myxococcales bacterium]|nr:hypothetical protein [Myxococcales bacterium]
MNKAAVVSILTGFLVTAQVAAAQPGAAPGTPATVIIIDPGVPAGPSMLPPSAVPAPAPAATPAPQNEPWDNVSHVNGTPVPVGERNDYLIKFKRTIISANPIAWMVEIYGVSVSVALSNNVAIHGDITAFGNEGTELSVGVPIYLRRTFQGPFLEPGLLTRTFDGSEESTGPIMLLGWHWMYESGFNLAAAFGLGRDLSDSDEYSSDQPFPAGYMRVGYAF